MKINHEIKYHRIEPKGRTQAIIAIVISALFLMLMAMVIIIKYHRIEPKGRTQAIIAIVISALFLMLMAMVIITTIQSPTYQQHLYYSSI